MPLLPDRAERARARATTQPRARRPAATPPTRPPRPRADDQGDPGEPHRQPEPLPRARPLAERAAARTAVSTGCRLTTTAAHAGRDPARDAVEGAAEIAGVQQQAGNRGVAVLRARRPYRPSASRDGQQRQQHGGDGQAEGEERERRGVGQPVLRADEAGAPQEHEQRRPPERLDPRCRRPRHPVSLAGDLRNTVGPSSRVGEGPQRSGTAIGRGAVRRIAMSRPTSS